MHAPEEQESKKYSYSNKDHESISLLQRSTSHDTSTIIKTGNLIHPHLTFILSDY